MRVRVGNVQSAINVTPLVDVVLVLLIIMMLVAPQLHSDAGVRLPETERPPDKPEDGRQITVVIDASGTMWVDDAPTTLERFPNSLREAAAGREDSQVVIKADGRLAFGSIEDVMLAVERAGFEDVGLIARRREE